MFSRYPQAGKAKTRLIPAVGAEGAAALQRQMTEQMLKQVKRWQTTSSGSAEIWFAGNTDADLDRQRMQDWLGNHWVYQAQAAGDLGARMSYAFQVAFAAGMERVVTIGTDCPQLDAERLTQAFQALHDYDLVLGVATDGGYYLIGLQRSIPELFVGVDWGTDQVLQQTVEIATSLGLKVAYLDPLTDIDRPEDLPIWETVQAATPQISIIIPVLNEARLIQSALQHIDMLQHIEQSDRKAIEVIVVDGGSQDDTVALAQQSGVVVIRSAPGRAKQMNVGAEIALGEILLFLHADTRLPDNFVSLVQTTLTRSGIVAGAFQLRIDDKAWSLRLVEWGVKWRSTLFQLPYGDQAIFLKAATFWQIGGFPELPIMEDFVLINRLRSLGKIAMASAPVLTSARRWQKLGVIKTTLINQLVLAAYFLGVPLDRIAQWYRGRGIPGKARNKKNRD